MFEYFSEICEEESSSFEIRHVKKRLSEFILIFRQFFLK